MATDSFKKLRPASFRGVAFEVEGEPARTAGRRNQVHEYPQRDKAYVEDIGRATREFRIVGFVNGDDYVELGNKLIDALEQPGAGTLIHPWYGSLNVSLKEPAQISVNGRALRVMRFEMNFVEDGGLANPSTTSSTPAQSRLSADAISSAASGNFVKKFDVTNLPAFVKDSAAAEITSVFGTLGNSGIPGASLLGYANTAVSYGSSALDLLENPLGLATKMLGFFGLSGITTSAEGWANMARSLVALANHAKFATPAAISFYTPSREQQYNNTDAVRQTVRLSLLSQAVGASSLASVAVHDDAIALRDSLSSALDNESISASDNVYQALTDARTNVWKDLTDRASNSARLTDYTPSVVMPALTAAYDLYEDAGRDTEIVQRNNIRHPGFLPHAPLKILTV